MTAPPAEVDLTGEYRSRGDLARVIEPLRAHGTVRVRVVPGSVYERHLRTLFVGHAAEVEPWVWEVRG